MRRTLLAIGMATAWGWMAGPMVRAEAGDVRVPGGSLSVETARTLAEHEGERLVFESLTDLPAAVARALALHRGGLVFPRLTKLSPAAARELAVEARGELRLPALVDPSSDTLRALADYDGPLHLDGVRSLPLDVAEMLKQRTQPTSLRGVTRIGGRSGTSWRAWAGTSGGAEQARDRGGDFDGEDDDPDEDDIPGEKSRGRGAGDADEDDADGDADDPDDSGVIGDDG